VPDPPDAEARYRRLDKHQRYRFCRSQAIADTRAQAESKCSARSTDYSRGLWGASVRQKRSVPDLHRCHRFALGLILKRLTASVANLYELVHPRPLSPMLESRAGPVVRG
jgi:hypothetical protein